MRVGGRTCVAANYIGSWASVQYSVPGPAGVQECGGRKGPPYELLGPPRLVKSVHRQRPGRTEKAERPNVLEPEAIRTLTSECPAAHDTADTLEHGLSQFSDSGLSTQHEDMRSRRLLHRAQHSLERLDGEPRLQLRARPLDTLVCAQRSFLPARSRRADSMASSTMPRMTAVKTLAMNGPAASAMAFQLPGHDTRVAGTLSNAIA